MSDYSPTTPASPSPASADDYPNSAMICLLPIMDDWCQIKLPHMTLVYVGEVADLKPSDFNNLAKDASSIAAITNSMTVRTMGVDVFGDPGQQVDVIKLQPTLQLLALRRFVEDWNASEYPFNPHCTIGPRGSSAQVQIPPAIAFDRIAVRWGEDLISFSLK